MTPRKSKAEQLEAATDLYPFTPQLTVERRQIVLRAEVEGDPVPWSRTGQGRLGQRYNVKRYSEHRNVLAWGMRSAYPHKAPLTVELGLWATFVRVSHRRVDIDNLAKAVMDAGTGLVWADDSQLSLLLCRVIVDPDRPRTELVVYRRELEVEPVAPSTDAL